MTCNQGEGEFAECAQTPASDPPVASDVAARPSGAALAVVASFFALFAVVGIAVWGLSFYYDFMVQQFGWTRAQVTSGNALGKLFIGPVFGFTAGWVVDQFGPRRLMITGILMAGAAVIGLGSSSTLPWLYIFYSLNALAFVCGGPLPAQVLVSRWFVNSRGKAMGIAYLGIGFGGAAVPWISHLLVNLFGWQMALRVLGLLIVLIALPFAVLVREAPGREPASDASAEVRSAFKSFSFALLVLGSMCSIAAVSGTQQNLKLFLSLDRHYPQADAAQIISLVLVFSIAGRILMGWLADRFPKKYVMLLIYLLVASSIPFMFLCQQAMTMASAAAIFGIGLGGDYMILPLMTAEIFGVKILGRLMGVILALGGVAEAVSPWWMGRLRDASGSYRESCLVLVGMAFLGAVAVLGLPGPRRSA
jgi:MFS family permease